MKQALIHTDGGATEDSEVGYYGGFGVHIAHQDEDDDREVLIYGAVPLGDTNNRAEMRAYIRAMKYVLDNNINKVRYILDSKYVIDGATVTVDIWENNGWVTSQGKPVKNKDLWAMIIAYQIEMRKAGVEYSIDWVKGHSGHHGNEMADDGATKGTALARAGDFDERVVDAKTMIEQERVAKEKRKKVKAVEPTAMLCGRRMFEMVNAERLHIDGKRAYMTVSYEDKDAIKARGLGVMSGERFEGLVVPNEPCEAYEDVLDYHESLLVESLIRPTVIYWDKLKSSATWKSLAQDGRGIFLKKGNDLILTDKATPITQYLNPPRQARRCLEEMLKKAKVLKSVRGINDDIEHERIDITDVFFKENDKGKKAFDPALAKAKAVTYNHKVDERIAKIIMTFDFEIPGRNALVKLLRQAKDVKCELIITDKTENTFRWHLYVETPMGYAIYNNPSTNLYVLPH